MFNSGFVYRFYSVKEEKPQEQLGAFLSPSEEPTVRQRVEEQQHYVEGLRQEIKAAQRQAERELEREQAHLRQQHAESKEFLDTRIELNNYTFLTSCVMNNYIKICLLINGCEIFPPTHHSLLESPPNSPAVDCSGDTAPDNGRAECHSGFWSSNRHYSCILPGTTDKSSIGGSGRFNNRVSLPGCKGQEEDSAGRAIKVSRPLSG